jgi:hypothetical protein
MRPLPSAFDGEQIVAASTTREIRAALATHLVSVICHLAPDGAGW